MKLLLITASAPEIKRIRKTRVIKFQQVTIPYLAAFVPEHWSVQHVDEECEKVDFSADVDLVAITFHTPSANHAYQIAARFQVRGITVVVGGPHVSLVPEEAAKYADVIFVGEAEGLWQQFLTDFEKGNYERRYELNKPFPGN